MRPALLVVLIVIAAGSTAASQELPKDVKALTVAVRESSSTNPDGAGVLVGLSDQTAFVVTARHVVYAGAQKLKVTAEFGALPGTWHPVDSILSLSLDKDLDLALLVISITTDLRSTLRTTADFQRRGTVNDLGFGDALYPVGCPSRDSCFRRPVAADRFESEGGGRIFISSRSIEPGHSGGALFNADWEVVGMVRGKIEAGEAEAISIDTIFKLLPVEIRSSDSTALRRRGIPRAGFPTRLEYALLAPTVWPADDVQGERWPGGRLSVARSINRWVSAHAAYLRLAPPDLDLKGGTVGLTVDPWWGGVASVRFFAEVGVASVQARIPGSPYLVGTETRRAVSSAEAVSLGLGLGLAPRITIPPGITVFAVVAYYRFGHPEGAEDLPDAFFGAGIGWGFR